MPLSSSGSSDLQSHREVAGVHDVCRGNGGAEELGCDFADFSGTWGFHFFLLVVHRGSREDISDGRLGRNGDSPGAGLLA